VKLLDSLLDAIVRLEGDALVMHVGEKPYVVTASSSMNAYRGPLAWGQVELSSRVLTFDAVSSMLGQILPADQQQALTEFGAIEHEIPSPAGVADRFTVVAARGGEDVWVEVRRRPIEIPQAQAPEAMPQGEAPATAEAPVKVEAPDADVAVPMAVHAVPAEPVAPEAKAADESQVVASAAKPVEPTAEPYVEPHAEPAAELALQEIELVADAQAHVDDQPAAHIQLEASESIVVAIPGQVAEEFELNSVPDNAIQIIDDEPQGVPTEEEVDAMLAATAAALLTSGLAGEVDAVAVGDVVNTEAADAAAAVAVPDEVLAGPGFELSPPPPVARVDEEASEGVEAMPEVPVGTPLFSDEAVLAAAAAEPVSEAIPELVSAPIPELTSELSPELTAEPGAELGKDARVEHAPLADVLVAEISVAEEPPVVGEAHVVVAEASPIVDHAPIVEPLTEAPPVVAEPSFAEASVGITIAESPISEPVVREPVIEAAQEVIAIVQVPAPAAQAPVETVPAHSEEPAMPVQPGERVAAEPSVALDTVDVRAEMPVLEGRSAREPEEIWQAVDETPVDAVEVDTLNAGAEQAVSEPTPHVWMPPAAEIPYEFTPDLRRDDEPVGDIGDRTTASPETRSPEAPEPVLHAQAEDETRQAVVVPLARMPIKPESVSVPYTPSEDAALMHTLRVAAARGASTVYVVAQSKPMIRIDGEIGPLESEPTLTAADVDRLVMELAPPRRRDALQNGPVEWLCDVPEIGRVRCLTFKDHRGPGVLFRMFPPRAISADQLALTPEVQALCQQSDGLVLVTGARASGKSTLLNAFVDLINRTRSDHLITIETQIGFVHESRRSFVSQRETRGDAELAATYARAALREDPDVMMIEDLKSAEIVSAALEAAESGRLVLASVPASSTIGALERLIEVFPADRRAKARTSLATALRGVVAQVLLRRVKGGRIAAREILLNTPAVSQLVLEGKMFQLPVALDSGRRHGMVPLTDSLAAHVRDGTVHVAEAYRKALDRAALVALLKREGIDTSFAERLA